MFFIKLLNYIYSYLIKLFYKILYGKKFLYGKHFVFRKGFMVMLDSNASLKIGDEVFFNRNCTIDAISDITIGNGSIFGENVKIYDHNHCFRDLNRTIKSQGYKSQPLHIGNHCWIGSGVILVKGANIGDNCVIGAGCVINCEIPNGTIVHQNNNSLVYRKIDNAL